MKKYFKNLKKLVVFERFSLLLTRIKGLKLSNFQIIFSVYFVIFSTFLLLSLPSLFNYEKHLKEIENEITSNFKLYLENISEVNYRFVPAPHIVIKKANLKFTKNDKSKIAELKNIKLFISLFELYKNRNINIKKIDISNGNFYFKNNDFFRFNHHLKKNIIKPIHISNSNFFYVNNNDEVATISPIKNLKYFIDFKNKKKELIIKGKLFDIDYIFGWNRRYQKPNISDFTINFKNPNINIINKTIKVTNNKIFEGTSKISFLDNKLDLIYFIDKEKILFKNEKNNIETISKTDFNGEIELNPFYFNINLILDELDVTQLIQKVFSYLYFINNSVHSSINGNFLLKINNNNKLFNDIDFVFSFQEGNIRLNKSSANLKKIGKINFSNLKFIERADKLYIKLQSELLITDQKQFYRRFQIPKADRINVDKIHFDFEVNVDDGMFYMFNLEINSINNAKKLNSIDSANIINEIKNIQQLTKIIKNAFKHN